MGGGGRGGRKSLLRPLSSSGAHHLELSFALYVSIGVTTIYTPTLIIRPGLGHIELPSVGEIKISLVGEDSYWRPREITS